MLIQHDRRAQAGPVVFRVISRYSARPRNLSHGEYRSWAAVLRPRCQLRPEVGTIFSSCSLRNTSRTHRSQGDCDMDQYVLKCSNARWWLTYAVVGLLCWPEVGAAADECNAARTTQPNQTDSHAPPPFDGQSLDNWMTLDGKPVTRGWEVVDGMIHLRKEQNRSGHIVTRDEYGDFDLSFEWKIAPRGNSGLKYRVRKYAAEYSAANTRYSTTENTAKVASAQRAVQARCTLYTRPTRRSNFVPPANSTRHELSCRAITSNTG